MMRRIKVYKVFYVSRERTGAIIVEASSVLHAVEVARQAVACEPEVQLATVGLSGDTIHSVELLYHGWSSVA